MIINKNLIRDYFIFSKRERRGVIALSAIVILIWLVHLSILIFTPEEPWDQKQFYKEIALLKKMQREHPNNYHARKNHSKKPIFAEKKRSEESDYIASNPNQIKFKEWMKLGLSYDETLELYKAKKKIKKFSSLEDLKKILPAGKSDKILSKLNLSELNDKPERQPVQNIEPAIKLNGNSPKVTPENPQSERKTKEKFELNSCSAWTLKQFDCIDSLMAQKIIQRRKSMGGYFSVEQLFEIDSLDESCISKIRALAVTDSSMVNKIDINKVSVKSLGRHPYIGYNVASALVNYRDKHGKFKNASDMKKCLLMTEEKLKKIKPYLIFSE